MYADLDRADPELSADVIDNGLGERGDAGLLFCHERGGQGFGRGVKLWGWGKFNRCDRGAAVEDSLLKRSQFCTPVSPHCTLLHTLTYCGLKGAGRQERDGQQSFSFVWKLHRLRAVSFWQEEKAMRVGRTATLWLHLFTGMALLYPSAEAWADAFVRFFAEQKVGQEITVTGGFRRFPDLDKRRYFIRDRRTGDVEYVEYYGMTMLPTLVVGNGSVSMKASIMDRILLFYSDRALVKDIPLKGESYWFTGTLIGYQYGTMGITRGMGIGGDPYILLRSVSATPPERLALPPQRKEKEDAN